MRAWISHMSMKHDLPEVHVDRFLMNGKALCLMSLNMFVYRVPLGGKLLFKDFQLRLGDATYREGQELEREQMVPELMRRRC